jgi:ADP-heptose:LPS heptosyltransferase
MYREAPPKREMNLLFNDGGLGDQLARLPAARYLSQQFPHVTFHIWVHDYFYELARHLMQQPGNVTINPLSLFNKYGNKDIPYRSTKSDDHSNIKTHLTDHGFHLLADRVGTIEQKQYLRFKADTSKITTDPYAVIATDYTAPVRAIPGSTVNGLISYFNNRGIIPVLLGKKMTIKFSKGPEDNQQPAGIAASETLDIREKTTLIEAGNIIAGAQVICGLDNGLLHLAGCTDTPIVAAYTTVRPEHRLPYRHGSLGSGCYVVEPDEDLACRFCQSNMDFEFTHDFRDCFYKDFKCTKQITADKFIRKLDELLG